MSLMGSIHIGASGLQTSQNALNTTAHNLANANTLGYTRQLVMQSARQYNTISINGSAIARQQLGLGVVYAETKTQRDYFLDKAFRRESGRSAFYEVSTKTLEEVENLLQELDGEAFANALNDLWVSIQDLANEPDQASRQSVFIQRCFEFLTRADAVYQGLVDYQVNMNRTIRDDIERINTIGHQIYDLNIRILRVEAGNVERANDLRDARDRLLDELSGLASISYSHDAFGNVNVKLEGNDFIKTDSINEIAIYTDPLTGFYTPYWENMAVKYIDLHGYEQLNIDGAHVFNLQQTISTEMNTDVGQVKAKLLARGTHQATFEDIAKSQDTSRDDYDPNHYDLYISQSIIMNMQAQFDQLINLVVQGINDILREAALAAEALDPSSNYMKDAYGNPLQVFNLIATDEPFTIKNVIINSDLRQAPTLLGFRLDDGQTDYATATRLKELFDARDHTLNPNVQTRVNIAGYYNAMVSQVANTSSVSREILKNQELTVEQVGAARDQVVGVSTDEELGFMIMFQNAFNASSRYVNVISEMLEHIISQLGRR
ncbi:MAG: flagellar hook-associated protein FlgK [Lachnospiraceae bacterium]|jgi:flagellar hook-associated protein 1 FlgK|nr:flagellar hook-associated protein FlgK [Lachnospiraceae bacterium]